MPFLFRISKGFISPQSLRYFLKSIIKSDLIILNIPNFEGLPLAIIAKLFGKKIISIFHCEVDLGDTVISRTINFVLNVSVYLQLFLSDVIVVYTKDYVGSLFVGKLFKNKIKTILPPVEVLPINQKKLKEMKKEKGEFIWIGYAGRVAKEKGLEYLIKAVSNIKYQISNIQIVFAGPYGRDVAGENEYYLKIKSLLDQYKIKYYFFGNLTAGNLGAFYKNVDVLVLPSINKTEAFGMVQVEAMLLGTPVIASNLPGVRVPIQLTKMGKIVEPKNSNKLVNVIEIILRNKSKYSNNMLINNAQKIFKAQKTYKFYNNLITTTSHV